MYYPGAQVIVIIPAYDRCGSREMRAFNGQTMTINRCRPIRSINTYDLDGAVSKMGVPFTFMEEWIHPVEV